MKSHVRGNVHGLRQRWMANSMSVVAAIMLMVCGLFSASIATYYYNTVQNALTAQAKAAVSFMNRSPLSGYDEYYALAYSYTQNFSDKDKIELQFIDTSGKVEVSSYNFTAGISPGTSDIVAALTGDLGMYVGNDGHTNEKIIAVSCPLTYDGVSIGAMRYVTSARLVNRQVLIDCAVIFSVGLTLLVMVYCINMVFIRKIVEPVAEVTEAVQHISSGSYGLQIENTYHEEIGALVDSINEMSTKISQNEKMQREFISSVSHELRTPLTAINGWGETLLGDTSNDPMQLRRGVGIILKESRRLTNMVEELLQFSRMQDGRFTLEVEPLDIQAEFEDAVFTYKELFAQDGIEVHYDDGGLEEFPIIEGDPERLKQVFCNLLDNAAKHGGNGGRIDTAIGIGLETVVLTIRDYGPGIPDAELPYIKQKFYKGSSKARGSGIGLAVVEEIVTRHGGRFEIGNAEGGGCIVQIYLPLKQSNS